MYFCGGGKRNKTLFLNVCVYVCNCCFVIEFKRGGGGGEGGECVGSGHCIFHKIVSLLLYTGALRKLYNCIFVFAEIFQLSF